MKNLIFFEILKNLEKIPPGFYLFQTPPFQKTTEKEFQSTLEELFCVPSGTFYLGYDDKSIEKLVFFEFLINLKQSKIK